MGFKFSLVAQVCHKRLCFAQMNCSIWFLNDSSCVTNSSIQERGIIVEGTPSRNISLGNRISYLVGSSFRMIIRRDNKPIVTTFHCRVDLLGLQNSTTVRMVGQELYFTIWGPIFGKFEALLNVRADIKNNADWKSIVFAVEGRMSESSRLYLMLENMIANETAIAANEATRRIAKAEATFNDAKIKADRAKRVLNIKQTAAEQLRIEKQRAADKLRLARLKYHMEKVRFNNTIYFLQNVQKSASEIKECKYNCSSNGCVIPDICQNPINVSFLEQDCKSFRKTVTVKVVEPKIEKREYVLQGSRDTCTGKVFYKVLKVIRHVNTGISNGALTGQLVGGAIGGVIGGVIGTAFGGPLGGVIGTGIGTVVGAVIGRTVGAFVGAFVGFFSGLNSVRTCRTIPTKPKSVEYYSKSFQVKAVDKFITDVKCTGKEKTKPGGYGPPYPCCKRYGCQTKVIDPRCVTHNEECLIAMTELKFKLDAMNATIQSAFLSLRKSVDEVKKATTVYEKTRIRHELAVSTFKKVKSYTEQRLSTVEIVNASMLHVRQIVDFGLKIAQAMNVSKSEKKKIVYVEDITFSTSVAIEDTKKILFLSKARSTTGKHIFASFLVDFTQIESSISSASKTIIAKLFGGKHSKKKRSTPEDGNDSTNYTSSSDTSFTDYRYACQFVNTTHLYLKSIVRSLGDLISSVKELKVNLSSGFHHLESLVQSFHDSSLASNESSVNNTLGYPNNSFVKDYLEMIEVLKNESASLTNDTSQSWNDTLESWRAFLEIFTSNNGFQECSGTDDCIDYLFEGAKEFYEFEDSARAQEIKAFLPHLREVMKSLTTDALTLSEVEIGLHHAVSLLNITHDDCVLCGGTPNIISSPQKEFVFLPGESMLLNCTAKREEGLTYAWKRNDKLIKESMDGIFFVPSVTKNHEGAYVCIVSNNKGSTLSNVTIVHIHSKPKITLHPQPQRVIVRSEIPATLTCND